MRHVSRLASCVFVIGVLAACGVQGPAGPSLRARDVWSRPAPAGGTGVVYLTLENQGRQPDRLTGARSDIAEAVELHRTKMEGDVMQMQPIAGGVEVPARSRVVFEPGGAHIMLIGLKRDLKAGDRFTVVLEFEKSGTLTVESEVRQP
ncbi:MAG: copper chaperone PCu(A)C [Anaerolineae bacterium]